MKKIFTALLAGLMSLSMFGCSKEEQPKQEEKQEEVVVEKEEVKEPDFALKINDTIFDLQQLNFDDFKNKTNQSFKELVEEFDGQTLVSYISEGNPAYNITINDDNTINGITITNLDSSIVLPGSITNSSSKEDVKSYLDSLSFTVDEVDGGEQYYIFADNGTIYFTYTFKGEQLVSFDCFPY